MPPPRFTVTIRDGTPHVRVPSGELMPLRRWRRLRGEHRRCCRSCPVRRRLEGN